MNIYLTWDYELFLGDKSGSIENCMIRPTDRLLELSNKYNIHFTFFVDATFLLRLSQLKDNFKELADGYRAIIQQIKTMISTGNDVQLHVHPHWLSSTFDGIKWELDYDRYKLSAFNTAEIEEILRKSKSHLEEIIGREITSFRAGGFSLQPFNPLHDIFKKLGLKIDSSVFSYEKYSSPFQEYDYSRIPNTSKWSFNFDPCIEESDGQFIELPIATKIISPLFYWRLLIITKVLKPKDHRTFGDGSSIRGDRKDYFRKLTKRTNGLISFDGLKAFYAENATEEYIKKKREHLVVIGHPKALSEYSLSKLENYINSFSQSQNFNTLKDFYEEELC